MRIRGSSVVLPLLAALVLSGEGNAAPASRTALGALPEAGPRAVALPEGVVVAESWDALARMVADPAGPRRIGLGPSVYRGELAVKRSVEIVGTKGSVLEGTGAGSIVVIDASDVLVKDIVIRHSGRRQTTEDAGIRAKGARIRLEHVTIEDSLFGISLEGCASCVVDGAHVVGIAEDPMLRGDAIKLWESDDAVVKSCVVEDSRDIVVWYSRRATLDGNFVTRSRYGAHLMYAHDAVVRRTRVVDNVVGIFVMYSSRVRAEDNVLAGASGPAGMGIGFKDSDDVVLERNWLVANTLGTYFDSTPRSPTSKVTFEGNVVALNDVGIRIHSSERGILFNGNDFHENAAMVEVEGGGDALGVEFHGNYFSNYEGYDLDRNGIGDIAYQVKLLSSVLTDAHPVLKLFDGTLAMGLMDAVARAVPVLSTKIMLTDSAPRMHPARLSVR